MCASPWLRARGDRHHAHSSRRALYREVTLNSLLGGGPSQVLGGGHR